MVTESEAMHPTLAESRVTINVYSTGNPEVLLA